MTKEEAIKEITSFLNDIELEPDTKLGQAMKMAIKALQQRTCDDQSIAIAVQSGMAIGFAKKYDEMNRVMEEIKKSSHYNKKWHWIFK